MAYNPGFFSSEEQDPLEQLFLDLSMLGNTVENAVKNNDTDPNIKAAGLLTNKVPLDISEIANIEAVPESSGSAAPAA